MKYFDAHCHLDFATTPVLLADGLDFLDVRVVSATVTPSDYRKALRLFAGHAGVQVGLGLHPWWIADRRASVASLEDFETLVTSTRFVSEVGLDFSPKVLASSVQCGLVSTPEQARALQEEVFERVLVASCNATYVSMHSVKAEKEVLDTLERCGVSSECAYVFHGFVGSQDQLMRALDLGCYVSVSPRMLSTKRGREYARQIPADRVLLETDAPSSPGTAIDAQDMRNMLSRTAQDLAEFRHLDEEKTQAFFNLLERTSERVLCHPFHAVI